jgi:hypothetical protein
MKVAAMLTRGPWDVALTRETFYAMSARLRIGEDLDPSSVAVNPHRDLHVSRWQISRGFVRPFHETYRVSIEVIPEPSFVKFLWKTEPIKIKVIQV